MSKYTAGSNRAVLVLSIVAVVLFALDLGLLATAYSLGVLPWQ